MHQHSASLRSLWYCLIPLSLWLGCKSYDSALLVAIRNQELGNVQRLLDGGAQADVVPEGETMFPLEAAAKGGNAEIVRMLLAKGAHPDSARGADAPLWLALQQDKEAAAILLVDAGAHFEGPMRKGMTPFYCAVMLNHTELVSKMVAHGADLYASGPQGSALHEAAENGNLALLKLLVSNGADINRINDLGETPLFLAAQQRQWEAVAWIVAHDGNADATNKLGNTVLHEMAKKDDSLGIREICKVQANPNLQNLIGETPLHVAAAHGNAGAAIALIEACQADLNLRDHHDLSPAGLAYREGETDMVDLLTALGGRLR
jgi:ankyrin repeat protein